MIATLTEVKNILDITDNLKDAQITTFLPIVQDEIIEYLNNYFITNVYYATQSISFSASSILDSGNGFITNGIITGNIFVDGSKYNDGLYTVSNVTTGALTISETLINESAGENVRITVVQFPKALQKPFADMISWSINQNQDLYGIKREVLPDGYSIEYDTTLTNYPKSIIVPLNKWRKVRM